jgi:large subunit ribosomal protein L7/L12
MSEKLTNIINELKTLTLLEASDLVKEIEKTFGVDTSISVSAGPILSNGTGNSASAVTEAVEEKTAFEISLVEVPADKKISVLKIVRSITGLGLKESKDIVDNVPKLLKEGITKEESDKFKKELEEAGAKVVIK